MRTTLDLDEDVLLAAKEMAARSKQTAGKVISDMFRRALQPAPPAPDQKSRRKNTTGFETIPAGGRVVTSELVRRLRDDSEES